MSELDDVCKPFYIADQVSESHMSQFRGEETYRIAKEQLASLRGRVTELETAQSKLVTRRLEIQLRARVTELEVENKQWLKAAQDQKDAIERRDKHIAELEVEVASARQAMEAEDLYAVQNWLVSHPAKEEK